jgi:hypothetical protein
MSGSQQLLLGESAGGGASGPVYIEDVFSTYLYIGNGSTQTITNGIDLAGKGGLVWIKQRQANYVQFLTDSTMSRGVRLDSASSGGTNNNAPFNVTSLNSNGFSLSDVTNGDYGVNGAPGGTSSGTDALYASWTFREQAKFFDIVTWTGDGASSRTLSHNLGVQPRFIIIKRKDTGANWVVTADKGVAGEEYYLNLNLTDAGTQGTSGPAANGYALINGGTSDTEFSIYSGSSGNNAVNASGGTYTAYLFASNAGGFGLAGADNAITCGSFTTNSVGWGSVTLGYEPQWILYKNITNTEDWYITDTMRGQTTGLTTSVTSDPNTTTVWLKPNSYAAEVTNFPEYGAKTQSQGFTYVGGGGTSANATYVYIAIRRGLMKVPTVGTSVFAVSQAIEPQSTSLFSAGFSDMSLHSPRVASSGAGHLVTDRLRGYGQTLLTPNENSETFYSTYMKYDSNAGSYISPFGYYNNSGGGSSPYVLSAFRRAPQFFDEVCYRGNNANRTLAHNLGVAPELMIVKKRTTGSTSNWTVYAAPLANNDAYLFLNSEVPVNFASVLWNSTAPTSTVFSLGASTNINENGQNCVAYLFATCAGVSKIGSYTGTGSTQTINCGFTGGARWVMIKRVDATGDWYYWNSASGIVAGNDPYLTLNTVNGQVTGTDYVDTAAQGFEISSSAPAAINANGGSFIFFAIA